MGSHGHVLLQPFLCQTFWAPYRLEFCLCQLSLGRSLSKVLMSMRAMGSPTVRIVEFCGECGPLYTYFTHFFPRSYLGPEMSPGAWKPPCSIPSFLAFLPGVYILPPSTLNASFWTSLQSVLVYLMVWPVLEGESLPHLGSLLSIDFLAKTNHHTHKNK